MGELAVVLHSQSPDEFATRLVLVQNAMRSQGNVLGGLAESRAEPRGPARHPGRQAQQVLAGMKTPAGGAGRSKIAGLQAQALDAQHAGRVADRRARVRGRRDRSGEKAAEEAAATPRCAPSPPGSAGSSRPGARQRLAAARARAAGRSTTPAAAARCRTRSTRPITSPYGMRTNPVTGIYKLHDGTDFGVGCGTPVHAAASGTVIQTALTIGYGNQLVIDHGVIRGVGVATSYNHLMSFSVGYGAHVSRGEVIGYSGGRRGHVRRRVLHRLPPALHGLRQRRHR